MKMSHKHHHHQTKYIEVSGKMILDMAMVFKNFTTAQNLKASGSMERSVSEPMYGLMAQNTLEISMGLFFLERVQ